MKLSDSAFNKNVKKYLYFIRSDNSFGSYSASKGWGIKNTLYTSSVQKLFKISINGLWTLVRTRFLINLPPSSAIVLPLYVFSDLRY